MTTKAQHIAIVGAGLIGSLLSIYLRKRGYAVSVYERRMDPRQFSMDGGRSINLALSNRGIRALKEVDLMDQVKSMAIPMHGRMMHNLQGGLSFLPYGKEGQYINSISRGGLNEILLNKAEEMGVMFYFDHRCVHVDLENSLMRFQSAQGDISEKNFDIIIGADGAFSAVRGAMQITDRFNYSQDYIEHGYKELTIPSSFGKSLERNALHIWPRESFMMIALPNPDGSFTCTLFLSFEGNPSFGSLRSAEDLRQFFRNYFPDALNMLPDLENEFNQHFTGSLITTRCYPWVKNNTLLIGDAAHAVVPFYGQGMNAGFEDCRILNELLEVHDDQWNHVFEEFQSIRKPDADAIATLALDNFVEMRDLVGDEDFLLRKKIEAKLHELFPDRWIPLYSMVTFHDHIRYSEALNTGRKQKLIMDEVMRDPSVNTSWTSLDFEKIVQQLT